MPRHWYLQGKAVAPGTTQTLDCGLPRRLILQSLGSLMARTAEILGAIRRQIGRLGATLARLICGCR
jgi:hypothetical protein